jgi:hypothetical protein
MKKGANKAALNTLPFPNKEDSIIVTVVKLGSFKCDVHKKSFVG